VYELKIPQHHHAAYGGPGCTTAFLFVWRDGLWYPMIDDVIHEWLNERKRDGEIGRTFLETAMNRRTQNDMFPDHISMWFETDEEAMLFKLKWL
jgi:hypothetical protein